MEAKCPKCQNKFIVSIPRRTKKQNDMYWGLIIPILSDHFGYFPDDMHEELKLIFNGKDSKMTPGGKYGDSTTKMTTKEFNVYCEQIKLWAFIQHGIEIPEVEDGETKQKTNS